jgi:hypothetical protein
MDHDSERKILEALLAEVTAKLREDPTADEIGITLTEGAISERTGLSREQVEDIGNSLEARGEIGQQSGTDDQGRSYYLRPRGLERARALR